MILFLKHQIVMLIGFLIGSLILPSLLAANPYQLFREQEYQKAEELFRQMLEKNSNDHHAAYNLGVSLYQQHRFEEAVALFQSAAASTDKLLKSQALYNKGMAEVMLNHLPAALESWRSALSFKLDDERIAENIKWLEEQLKAEDQQKNEEEQLAENEQQQDSQNKEDAEQKTADKQQSEAVNEEQKQAEDMQQSKSKSEKQDAASEQGENQQLAENNEAQENSTDPAEEGDDQQFATGDEKEAQSTQYDANGQEQLASSQEASEENAEDRLLSAEEMEIQDAEKLIRSIEDQIGRFHVPIDRETLRRRQSGNAW